MAEEEQVVLFLIKRVEWAATDKVAADLTDAAPQACRAKAKLKYPRVPVLIVGKPR